MMEQPDEKCVLVLDGDLPVGVQANTAAILGVSLGRLRPEMVGEDILDASGCRHPGIVRVPIPVLRGSAELLRQLRKRLAAPEYETLTMVDFSDLAQSCHAYQEFTEKLSSTKEENLSYIGLALYGPKRMVNKLVGSLPLLR